VGLLGTARRLARTCTASKEWECTIENFTEEEADTTVHQIHGQRATLSVNYKPGDWGCTSLDIESGIRLASGRNSRGSAEYEQVRSRVTRSGHSGWVTASHSASNDGGVMDRSDGADW